MSIWQEHVFLVKVRTGEPQQWEPHGADDKLAVRSDDEETLRLGFWDQTPTATEEDPYLMKSPKVSLDFDTAHVEGSDVTASTLRLAVENLQNLGVANETIDPMPVDGDDKMDNGALVEEPKSNTEKSKDDTETEKPKGNIEKSKEDTESEKPKDDTEKKTPKVQKRMFMKDLTPNSKKKEEERRKQLKRDTSRAWHQKWESKGVPKKSDDEGQEATRSNPDQEAASSAATPVQEAANSTGPAGPAAKEETIDDFGVSQGLLEKSLGKDLRSVRPLFMEAWKSRAKEIWPDLKPADINQKASDAWIKSELRAQVMAGRTSVQY